MQNGSQPVPSQTARLSAPPPPAFVNVPPAKTLPPETATAKTSPFVICSVDELTAFQVLPFHVAMRSALAIPPALVNLPPT
jgi:hypothetical protein